jgi:acyl-coenzyme A synthetase/AMP-(fatty) acid ligase
MNMLRNSRASLRDGLSATWDLVTRSPGFPVGVGGAEGLHAAFFTESRTRGHVRHSVAGNPGSVFGAEETIAWSDLIAGTVLEGRANELCERSVLVATTSQLTAIATLVELDGVARRIVLYPPDLSLEHLAYVAQAAAVEAIVSDRTSPDIPGIASLAPCSWRPCDRAPKVERETEWVLLTSGTTGRPKLVVHTLASLAGAIEVDRSASAGVVWGTYYDIRRYGGLQIFLRAALTGTSLVLSSALESTADFLARAGSLGVTHISGTPSHWRRASMSSSAHLISPKYVRLSGEIADQAILNHLRSLYPQAKVAHAFATTEAGVVFAVNDGLMGFPTSVIEKTPDVVMKIEDRTLRVHSDRTARCYLGDHARAIPDADGFVDTGDVLEVRDGRYYFVGRGDGMINVGGMKVYPEEVEAVINGHPRVQMSLVRTKKNPFTGALVVADVVLKSASGPAGNDMGELHQDILRLCRETLASHKVPAAINFVPALAVAETGKLIRRYA